MKEINVRYQRGDQFHIRIGDHGLVVDQPIDAGGDDVGPTPTELFVASLAGCVAYYAERFMRRHEIEPDGLGVDCFFSMSTDRPARVSAIDVRLVLPPGFPAERHTALMRVVEHCTVHNSIMTPPEIRISASTEASSPSTPALQA